jgi:hypothetical protein
VTRRKIAALEKPGARKSLKEHGALQSKCIEGQL